MNVDLKTLIANSNYDSIIKHFLNSVKNENFEDVDTIISFMIPNSQISSSFKNYYISENDFNKILNVALFFGKTSMIDEMLSCNFKIIDKINEFISNPNTNNYLNDIIKNKNVDELINLLEKFNETANTDAIMFCENILADMTAPKVDQDQNKTFNPNAPSFIPPSIQIDNVESPDNSSKDVQVDIQMDNAESLDNSSSKDIEMMIEVGKTSHPETELSHLETELKRLNNIINNVNLDDYNLVTDFDSENFIEKYKIIGETLNEIYQTFIDFDNMPNNIQEFIIKIESIRDNLLNHIANSVNFSDYDNLNIESENFIEKYKFLGVILDKIDQLSLEFENIPEKIQEFISKIESIRDNSFALNINDYVDYNDYLDMTPDKQKLIFKIKNVCNICTDFGLPDHITHIIFSNDFNQPLDILPSKLLVLIFGNDFNQPLPEIPNLIYLKFGANFDSEMNNLPNSLIYLEVGKNFKQVLPKFPHNLCVFKVKNI